MSSSIGIQSDNEGAGIRNVLWNSFHKFPNEKLSESLQTATTLRQKALSNKWFQAACVAVLVFIIYFVTSKNSTAFVAIIVLCCCINLRDTLAFNKLDWGV